MYHVEGSGRVERNVAGEEGHGRASSLTGIRKVEKKVVFVWVSVPPRFFFESEIQQVAAFLFGVAAGVAL